MTHKEIGILEAIYHECFEKRQECAEDSAEWEFYQGQMDIIDEIEDRLGVDTNAYWNGGKEDLSPEWQSIGFYGMDENGQMTHWKGGA